MVTTLMRSAPAGVTTEQRPATIIELAGPAGAGKTTVAQGLIQTDQPVKVGPDISLRTPRHLAAAVLSVPELLTVMRFGHQNRRRLTWDELKSIIYLNAWPRLLTKGAANYNGTILLDQGPIFRLATLHAFGPESIRKPAAGAWWSEMFTVWAAVLGLVIWLDAPNKVLDQRINTRDRWHMVKGASEREVTEFLDRYRTSYQEVLAGLSANGGLKIITFDTSQQSASEMVSAILDTSNLKPEQQ